MAFAIERQLSHFWSAEDLALFCFVCTVCVGTCLNLHITCIICASDKADESPGSRVLSSFSRQTRVVQSILPSLCVCLEGFNLILPVIFSLSHIVIFSLSLHAFNYFSLADVLTDRIIALEADTWTWDDIALRHELMHKLGRISGIHPCMSYLIIQGGGGNVFMDLIVEQTHIAFDGACTRV